MNAIYGPKERTELASLSDSIAANNRNIPTVLGPAIADKLRTELPDLDDLTIGRVLVAIGTCLPGLFQDASAPQLAWGGLLQAGLDMTEPEWKDL